MCGIFGQINKTKQGKFNFPAFTTFGIANDTRGGDSCGIFIDGKTEYGIDKQKYFADFIQTSKLLNNTKTSHIALGHCRKASVGKIGLETAQPVIIKENDEVKFVVIHNGTIYNYQELAHKYIPEINITGMTDSQVMAHIFYHKGYDCLNEYNGGAVFVIVDYRPVDPLILCFKGQSKQYYSSQIDTDERPFYFTTVHGSLYFSSLYHWLVPFAKNEQIYTITPNQVIKLENLNLKVYQEIDRSKCIQTKKLDSQCYTNPYYSQYDNDYQPLSSYNTTKYTDKTISVNQCGIYMCGDEFVHGSYYVQPSGKIGYNSDATYLHFWNGVLLKNYQCYKFLTNFAQKSKLSPVELCYTIPDIINFLSFYPFMDADYDYKFVIHKSLTEKEIYNGEIHWIGEDCVYKCVDGVPEDYYPATSDSVFKQLYTNNLRFSFNPTTLHEFIIEQLEETK